MVVRAKSTKYTPAERLPTPPVGFHVGAAADRLSIGDGHLDLYTGLDVDRRDLLDDLGRRVQIDDALVDAHLEAIPRLGALTARGLAGGDAQHLVRHADRSLDAQLLLLGARNQIGAHLLQRRHVLRRERDADAVHLRHVRLGLLQILANESLHIWNQKNGYVLIIMIVHCEVMLAGLGN